MMRKIFLLLLAGVVLVCGVAAWAEKAAPGDLKPVAVLSLGTYDKWMANLAFVGKLSDNPDLPKGVEAIVKLATRSRGLAALDKTRPCGAIVFTNGAKWPAAASSP